MKARTIHAADLFCGAGGSSTGLDHACQKRGLKLNLLAINHWDTAIETHSANHPEATHLCMNVDQVDPRKAVPSGKLDILIASPECTHHSVARGGRPINDQSRASAWLILRWAEALDIKNILIENVPEFTSWGPLGTNGRPLKTKKGKTFLAFIAALESLGYAVKYRVLNAADYGDPTTRRRLFILARKGRRRVVFPEPTHTPDGRADMFRKTKRWRAAREIIDWNLKGESIFSRKKPLSPNTMRRIFAGLAKFSGGAYIIPFFGEYEGKSPRVHDLDAPLPAVTSHGAGGLVQPFLVSLRGTSVSSVQASASSVDAPVPTLTAQGNHVGVAQPFLVAFHGGDGSEDRTHSVESPLPTVDTQNRFGVAQPFVLNIRGGKDGYLRGASVNDPVQAITTEPALALVEPFLVGAGGPRGHGEPKSIDDPMPTVLSENHFGLVEPFILGQQSQSRPRGVGKPLPTVAADGAIALVEPFIVPVNHGPDDRTHSVAEPLPTITAFDAFALAEPFLTQYNGSGAGVQPVTEPLPTQTARDRFGLVVPELHGAVLDIRFRMLTPKELAAAMSFPKDYKFAGNREKVVKQIGNAVAVNMAAALCGALLD